MARLYLTQREYDELYENQGRKCWVAGCTESEGLIGEHSTPQAWLRAKPDQLMCRLRHKPKTRKDIQAIWKAKLLNGEVMGQCGRRKKFGSQLRRRGYYRSSR